MPITRIVVGVDGSVGSGNALQFTAELAAATGADVIAVHAFEPLALVGKIEPPLDFVKIKHDTEELLRTQWCHTLTDALVPFRPLVVEQDPVNALIDTAKAEGGDLIVVGTRGIGGLRGLVVGTVADKLPEKTHVPVVIVPPD